MRMLAFRSLFAAGCFSAFAIFGWGIETATVLELLLLLVLIVLAMIVPAAVFVCLLKLISYGLKRLRSESQSHKSHKSESHEIEGHKDA